MHAGVHTVIGGRELLLHHGLEGRLDIPGVRVARAIVHAVLVNHVVGRMARLQDVERTAHVALAQGQDRLLGLGLDLAPVWSATPSGDIYALFGLDHVVETRLHLARFQRREAEAGAAALDGGNDFVHIVADDAKAHITRVLLHHCRSERQSGAASTYPAAGRPARPASWRPPRPAQ